MPDDCETVHLGTRKVGSAFSVLLTLCIRLILHAFLSSVDYLLQLTFKKKNLSEIPSECQRSGFRLWIIFYN